MFAVLSGRSGRRCMASCSQRDRPTLSPREPPDPAAGKSTTRQAGTYSIAATTAGFMSTADAVTRHSEPDSSCANQTNPAPRRASARQRERVAARARVRSCCDDVRKSNAHSHAGGVAHAQRDSRFVSLKFKRCSALLSRHRQQASTHAAAEGQSTVDASHHTHQQHQQQQQSCILT